MNDNPQTREQLQLTLKELNVRLAHYIWGIPFAANKQAKSPRKSRLVMPSYRSGAKRVSEQEARFACCALLERSEDFFYSVETPTTEDYFFEGKEENKRSGCIDLTLYHERDGGFERVVNIEYKAGPPSGSEVEKDLQKLLKERGEILGNFFHLLDNSNSGTLPALFDKLQSQLTQARDRVVSELAGRSGEEGQHPNPVLFSVCILQKKYLVQRWYDPSKHNDLSDFFCAEAFARRELPSTHEGWDILCESRGRK